MWHDQYPTSPATPVTLFRDFTVWSKTFIGGLTVAVADLNLDGRGDVVVGSGPGMQPSSKRSMCAGVLLVFAV